MKKDIKTKSILIVLFLLGTAISSFATTKYWIGTGAATWGNGANWSISSGGGGGAGAPGSGDVATFDANGGNCNINSSATPGTLTVTNGYAGTISQNSGISIGSGGASLSGGTFTGGGAGITCGGHFTISGMAFTSTSGTLTVGGNFTLSSGSFTHNSGTTLFSVSKTITGSTTFYDLTLGTPSGGAATHTVASGTVLTVAHTLTLSTTNALTINTGEIYAQGDITINNTATGGGGTALIKINGTGSQTLTGSGTAGAGKLCKVEVDKSAGTLTLASIISVDNDWTYTTGTVSSGSGTPTVATCSSLNLDCQGSGGTMSFYNLTVYGGTTTLTGNVGITNNLTINNSTTLNGSSYTINLSGQWTNNGTYTYSTSTVQLQGTALQTINTSSSTETFYNLTVNKTSGRVLLNDPLIINNAVTFTEGIIKATGSNYFKLIDNATAGAGNDSAFVYGFYKKVGDDAFTFALGDTGVSTGGYHPLSIGAPSSATDAYTAQYFNSVQTNGTTRDSILNYTSTCEYWNLARDAGSSNVTVKLGWNTTSCNIDSLTDIRVAYWNGSKWKDKGGSYTGTTTIGDVVTSSAQSSFGDFIIAKKYKAANAGADVMLMCNADSTNLVGSTGTSYNWTPSTGLSCTNCYNPIAFPPSTTTYTYTVTYPSGYQSSDNITITVNTITNLTTYADCTPATYTVSDSVKWFSFTPDTNNVFIQVKNLYGLVDSNFASRLDLYSGICGNLTLVNTSDPILMDSMVSMPAFGLLSDSTYLLKVTFTDVAGSGHIDICVTEYELAPNLTCGIDCNPCVSLVRNGDFESANCPHLLTGGNIFPANLPSLLDCWFNPDRLHVNNNSVGTPDYFNVCADLPPVAVPINFGGFQWAHNGSNGYAGFYAYLPCQNHDNGFTEYVEQELCSPMVEDVEYTCTFYVNLANMSTRALDQIGMFISTGPVYADNGILLNSTNGHTPQIVCTYGTPITNMNGWTQITGTYTATGGEDHITIGCFREAAANYTISTVSATSPYPGNQPCAARSYYYIDDVSIVSNLPHVTPVITGQRSLCDYSSINLSVPAVYGSYNWSVSPTPDAISGATTNSVTFSYNSKPSGNVTVTFTYDFGDGCEKELTYILYACCECPGQGVDQIPCTTIADMDISTYGGATPLLKDIYYFNGIINIDVNTTFEGATVYFGPYAKINVESGVTLTIKNDVTYSTNSILLAGCEEMWDGIYIEDNTAKLLCDAVSPGGGTYNYIRDAINAVVSVDGGDYDIERTFFENNYKGIVVQPYSGTHTGVIKTSTFTNNGGSQLLAYPPYAGITSLCGFEISSVYDLTVGVIGSSLANTFEFMDFGIRYDNLGLTNAYTSTLKVYNNYFSDIVKGTAFNGIGIVAEGEVTAPISLKIGSATANSFNYFNYCTYGIFASQFCKTEVKNNVFGNIEVTDITAFRNINPVTITDNASTTYNRGIWVIDYIANTNIPPNNAAYNSVNIGNNSFSTASSQTAPFNNYENTAILVQNVNLKNIGCKIYDNTIQNFRYGIITTHIASAHIHDNVLSAPITPSSTYQILGIYDELGRYNLIEDNILTHTTAPISTDAGNLRGIYDFYSRQAIIRHNQVTKYYDGITMYGSCNDSKLYCNILTDFYMGFNFLPAAGATIGWQLPLTIPTGNEWISGEAGGSSMAGQITPPVEWYYLNSGTQAPSPADVLGTSSLITSNDPYQLTGVSNPCSTPPGGGNNGQKRQLALEDAILDTVQVSANQDAYSYFNKKYAYLSLLKDVHDTSWLSIGTADAFYQDFFDSCATTNLDAYSAVQDFMDTINIDEAINLNGSIVDSNQFESDRKVVNDIYIRTWLSGIRDFTTEQRDTLEYIANLDSREYGDAVISARVLLGLEVPHNATFGKGFKPYKRSQKQVSKKPIEKDESLVTNLYPNPAKGEIKVEVSEEGTLEMFNLLGEKVIFTTLVKGTTSISTIMLQPGIYIYSIYINGKVAKRDKLVISQ